MKGIGKSLIQKDSNSGHDPSLVFRIGKLNYSKTMILEMSYLLAGAMRNRLLNCFQFLYLTRASPLVFCLAGSFLPTFSEKKKTGIFLNRNK